MNRLLREGCWLTATAELFVNRGLGWYEQDIHEHGTTEWFVVVVMRSGLLIFVGALVWARSVYLENKGIEALAFRRGKKKKHGVRITPTVQILKRKENISFPFSRLFK